MFEDVEVGSEVSASDQTVTESQADPASRVLNEDHFIWEDDRGRELEFDMQDVVGAMGASSGGGTVDVRLCSDAIFRVPGTLRSGCGDARSRSFVDNDGSKFKSLVERLYRSRGWIGLITGAIDKAPSDPHGAGLRWFRWNMGWSQSLVVQFNLCDVDSHGAVMYEGTRALNVKLKDGAAFRVIDGNQLTNRREANFKDVDGERLQLLSAAIHRRDSEPASK